MNSKIYLFFFFTVLELNLYAQNFYYGFLLDKEITHFQTLSSGKSIVCTKDEFFSSVDGDCFENLNSKFDFGEITFENIYLLNFTFVDELNGFLTAATLVKPTQNSSKIPKENNVLKIVNEQHNTSNLANYSKRFKASNYCLLRTSDGGKTWRIVLYLPFKFDILFLDTKSKTIIIKDQSLNFYQSIDFGKNWTKIIDFKNSLGLSLDETKKSSAKMTDETHGYILIDRSFFTTQNGWKSFEPQKLPDEIIDKDISHKSFQTFSNTVFFKADDCYYVSEIEKINWRKIKQAGYFQSDGRKEHLLCERNDSLFECSFDFQLSKYLTTIPSDFNSRGIFYKNDELQIYLSNYNSKYFSNLMLYFPSRTSNQLQNIISCDFWKYTDSNSVNTMNKQYKYALNQLFYREKPNENWNKLAFCEHEIIKMSSLNDDSLFVLDENLTPWIYQINEKNWVEIKNYNYVKAFFDFEIQSISIDSKNVLHHFKTEFANAKNRQLESYFYVHNYILDSLQNTINRFRTVNAKEMEKAILYSLDNPSIFLKSNEFDFTKKDLKKTKRYIKLNHSFTYSEISKKEAFLFAKLFNKNQGAIMNEFYVNTSKIKNLRLFKNEIEPRIKLVLVNASLDSLEIELIEGDIVFKNRWLVSYHGVTQSFYSYQISKMIQEVFPELSQNLDWFKKEETIRKMAIQYSYFNNKTSKIKKDFIRLK